MQKINSCLWFDNQAEEAVKLYTSIFKNSKVGKISRYGESGAEISGQQKDTVMTIDFEIEGQEITALNGGPTFTFTPALSFFVWCDTEKEIGDYWQKFSTDGKIRMGLDKYPWADKYGWTADKYGVEWQFILKSNKQKIAPAFLFVDKLFGKGEEAINFYMSLFKNSKIETMSRDETTKTIMHCIFSLAGQNFVLMEGQGEHGYTFSHAFSLVAVCESQEEIDALWAKLAQGGEIEECGWLKDKFGVSWQVVPRILRDLMSEKDPKKAERVMKTVLQMKKIDIKTLEKA